MKQQTETNRQLMELSQENFDRQLKEQQQTNAHLLALVQEKSCDQNCTAVCVELFKLSDFFQYWGGNGFNSTGLSFEDWTYAQSPLAGLMTIFSLIARWADSTFATYLTKRFGIEKQVWQKVYFLNF